MTQCREPQKERADPETLDSHWSGIGFGIEMSAEWYGVEHQHVSELNAMVVQTIRDFEAAFSLYSASSELSRLNSQRELERPSILFMDVLERSRDLVRSTQGLFQPAIHGAWKILDAGIGQTEWKRHMQGSSLEFLKGGQTGLKFENSLTQVSFNAIVQGCLADHVAQRAREMGVCHALLHLGETYAIGQHPEGRDWSLAVMGTPEDGEIDLVGAVELADAGLAVSAHDATRKLINPLTSGILQYDRVVAVMSKRGAAVADAFATAFAVADEQQWGGLFEALRREEGCSVKIWQSNQLVFERV